MFNLSVVYPESNRVIRTCTGNVTDALQINSVFFVEGNSIIFVEDAVGLNVLGVFGRRRIVGIAGRAKWRCSDVFPPVGPCRANQDELMATV